MIKGRCTCGQVQYHLTSTPLIVHGCHCTWCQRETGTAFAQNALIEADRVIVDQGQVEKVKTPTASGRGQLIARCPTCRVAVWSAYTSEALAFIRVGTLETPSEFPPDIHIYTVSKQDWVILPQDKPAVEGYYNMKEVWSAESWARFTVLFPKYAS